MSELAAAAVRTWWRPTMAELRWMNHDEALKRYRTTLRRATTAQFPATPALSHAATVCAFYAQANLVSEEQARRHLHTGGRQGRHSSEGSRRGHRSGVESRRGQ